MRSSLCYPQPCAVIPFCLVSECHGITMHAESQFCARHLGVTCVARCADAVQGPEEQLDAEEALRSLQLEELQDCGTVGSGASGVVNKVVHLPTGRTLALKVCLG